MKYSGLKAWEIFISESQERMSFVVKSDRIEELFKMASDFEVELTDIGQFTDSGFLDLRWEDKSIAYLDLDFLHDGVPKKHMEAEWKKPVVTEPTLKENLDYNDILLKLMGSLNICSRESIIRRYDHEVKGKGFDSFKGIAVSNGILPKFGDIDAYEMSAGSFDEAIRGIIAVGGKLPDPKNSENNFWSVNDNFCVPDSAYNPKSNPDGKYKLAQLVRMNEALFDMSTFFNIPMTSGKDSMKNDFIKEGIKISVPPTILYSVAAKIKDVRQTLTAEFKQAGDLIYLVGKTYDELGGSDFYKLFNEIGANVPVVRKEDAQRIYHKMMEAHDKNLLSSAHDLSDGGLAVALAESAFGGEMGVSIELPDNELSVNANLFSESHSRFIVSVNPEDKDGFEILFGNDVELIGKVNDSQKVQISKAGKMLIDLENEALLNAWRSGLVF
ncbi:MAG: AIR synthase-related protein [Calditrichaceae bacterium]